MKTMNKAEKFWDKTAAREKGPVDGIGDTELKTVELTRKYVKTSDVVLDFACGTGAMTVAIANHVKEIHALDISSKMLDIVKRKADARQTENISFIHGTLFDGQIESESLDVILAFNVLHLLDDQKSAIQRINELLKPGGTFISATPCLGESMFIRFAISLLTKLPAFPDVTNLKAYELESLITTENFQVVDTEIMESSPLNYFIVARKK